MLGRSVAEQLVFPVAQRCGPLLVLRINCGLLVGTGELKLLVQVAGVRAGADPPLDGRQPPLDAIQAGLHPRQQDRLRRPWAGRPWLSAEQQLDDLLADPVQVGAQRHKDLGGDALALADQAEQDVCRPASGC